MTPQLADRLTARFRVPAAVLHSGLNEGERMKAWADARAGRARLVVGTRSAVFVPCPELGLIVVDEEHDPSYKQQDGFRYQARDLAVMRASKAGIPVVLGSATPALESLLNVQRGRYTHRRLTKKVTGTRPPLARVVDLNRHPPRHGLSAPLVEAMSEQLESGSQVLLYLNRPRFRAGADVSRLPPNGRMQPLRCSPGVLSPARPAAVSSLRREAPPAGPLRELRLAASDHRARHGTTGG